MIEIPPMPVSNKLLGLKYLTTWDDLVKLKEDCTDKPLFIFFWSSKDENSEKLKSMMEKMPKVYRHVMLAYVNYD